MLKKLLLLFIAVPLLELLILVKLGTVVGFWPTVGLVLLTGTVGAMLAKSQGMRVLRGIQSELAVGRVPAARLLDGLLILIGGIVLLTPGLLTDIAGLLLLFPPTRNRLKRPLRRKLEGMARSGRVSFVTRIR
jgi:UPF0716 protein FxsA